VSEKDIKIEVNSEKSSGCRANSIPDDLYETIEPRIATGKAPFLLK
jgi:hypothetical protein